MTTERNIPPTLRQLLDALVEERLAPPALLDRRTPEGTRLDATLRAHDDRHAPWFVRAAIGFGVWIGASFLSLFALLLGPLDGAAARLVVGTLLLAAACALRRVVHNDLGLHLGLTLSFSGQALLLAGLAAHLHGTRPLLLVFIGLQLGCIALLPDRTHRFLSTVAAVLALWEWTAIQGARAPMHAMNDAIVVGVALLTSLLWLFEARVIASRFADLQRPAAYGLTIALLVVTAMATPLGGLADVGLFGQLAAPSLTSGLLCALVLGVALHTARAAGQSLLSPPVLSCAAALVVVGLLAHKTPAIPAALLVMALAHARRARLLDALAVLLLGVGLFELYYALSLSLLEKSLAVCATGLLLVVVRALLALLGATSTAEADEPIARPARLSRLSRRRLALSASAALSLVVVGALVVHKERVLKEGELVLLELAPRDPRSLMQGDYMELRYRIAPEVGRAAGARRGGVAVLSVDEQRVARFVRVDDGTPLAPSERLLRFRIRKRSWGGDEVRLGAESFFFEEGQASRYQPARHGALRVTSSGESVLVGLYGDPGTPL